jgi:hypothetical protein
MNSYWRYILYFLLPCFFCLNACSKKTNSNLRFAFIGDIHYSVSDYSTTENLVRSVASGFDSLKLKPEFVIQTGDFFHATSRADLESEAAFAFKNFGENIHIPFFIAKGNHDTRSFYEKNALPVFSRELEKDILKSYYSFNKANCHFIILDCSDEKLGEQLLWLEKDLETAKSNRETEHIFVAGHYPLWIVARAGFTRPEYATPVASLLARYKVDAYFCGHTHNKTTTVRLINGQPLTQIMDAGVVEKGRLFNLAPYLRHIKTETDDIAGPGMLPLEEGHQIFIPESELVYFWGYQEGSPTSYYIITVEGKSVQADWMVLGNGVVRSFKWDQPGKLVNLKSPVLKENKPLAENDLKQIENAWFYAAPWTSEDSISAPFSINGVNAGIIKMSRAKMSGSPFWNKIEVPLDRSAIDVIKEENEISITNPVKGKFGLAHISMMIQFKDGRFARSTISQKVLTSFQPSEVQYNNFPSKELIEPVDTVSPLKKIVLRFGSFYGN